MNESATDQAMNSPTPAPLSAERLAEAHECANAGYVTLFMVKGLLATIAARDETIAGLETNLAEGAFQLAEIEDALKDLRANVGDPL